MTGRTHSNTGEARQPSYAALCLGAMGSSTANLDGTASPTAAFLTHGMQMLKERLMRQSLISPTYKSPYWRFHKSSSTFWGTVDVMRSIDEIIEVVNEKDRYGPREVFEEPDAEGRWACFVDNIHKQRQAAGWDPTAAGMSWDARLRSQERSLADRYCDWDLDSDSEPDDDGIVRCFVDDSRQEDEGESPPEPSSSATSSTESAADEDPNGANIPSEARLESQVGPSKSRRVQTNENERPTIESSRTISSSAITSWETVEEVDNESSEDDEDTESEEAERERISRLFEDFPTCVERTERRTSSDEEYGTMTTNHPASQWTLIETRKLPRRIREYLADLSIAHAQDSRYTTGPHTDLHRWLFATPRNEFVFDALTMNMWYRSLDPLTQQALPDQPT